MINVHEKKPPRVPKAIRHLQGARAPMRLLVDALRPSLARDPHRVVPARARGCLERVVVRHLAVRRVDDLVFM
jgi:hypothetical protein